MRGRPEGTMRAISPLAGRRRTCARLACRRSSGSVLLRRPRRLSSAAAWDRAATYTADKQVSHNGHTWKAKWWTQGQEPGTTGEWGVWQDLGAC